MVCSKAPTKLLCIPRELTVMQTRYVHYLTIETYNVSAAESNRPATPATLCVSIRRPIRVCLTCCKCASWWKISRYAWHTHIYCFEYFERNNITFLKSIVEVLMCLDIRSYCIQHASQMRSPCFLLWLPDRESLSLSLLHKRGKGHGRLVPPDGAFVNSHPSCLESQATIISICCHKHFLPFCLALW